MTGKSPDGSPDAQEENARLRAATSADAPGLARMRYAFRASMGSPIESEAVFVERCTRWMERRLAGDTQWRCWLAEMDGEMVGQLWLHVIEKIPNPVEELECHAYVTNVFVSPEVRSQGIGGRLIQTALDWCRDEQVDSVILWPTPRSRMLYERFGFKPDQDILALRMNASQTPEVLPNKA